MTTTENPFISILSEPVGEQDRRRSIRMTNGSLASVRQMVSNDLLQPLHVIVIDVSDGGLGLRSAINLARGGQFRVTIDDAGEPYTTNVKVVTSRRRRDGSYDIGTRFVGLA